MGEGGGTVTIEFLKSVEEDEQGNQSIDDQKGLKMDQHYADWWMSNADLIN